MNTTTAHMTRFERALFVLSLSVLTGLVMAALVTGCFAVCWAYLGDPTLPVTALSSYPLDFLGGVGVLTALCGLATFAAEA